MIYDYMPSGFWGTSLSSVFPLFLFSFWSLNAQWYFMVSEAIKHCALYKPLILKKSDEHVTCDVFYIFMKWMDG